LRGAGKSVRTVDKINGFINQQGEEGW
jgi:hypothetical protein